MKFLLLVFILALCGCSERNTQRNYFDEQPGITVVCIQTDGTIYILPALRK
jgi:hypothetical protein